MAQSPTISAPAIHYTSTIEATGVVQPDDFIFIAYDKTWQKRILHIFSAADGLSLHAQRPLHRDGDVQTTTTTVFDLLTSAFSDDAASLHLFIPRRYLDSHGGGASELRSKPVLDLVDELERMSSKLPVIPFGVARHSVPEPLTPGAACVTVVVTSRRIDPGAQSPVIVDGFFKMVNKLDAM